MQPQPPRIVITVSGCTGHYYQAISRKLVSKTDDRRMRWYAELASNGGVSDLVTSNLRTRTRDQIIEVLF
jgi:hypothetical protein